MVFHILWGILAAVITGAVASVVWTSYRSEITAWLARNGLQESALAEAFVILDRVVTSIKAKLQLRTKGSVAPTTIHERTLDTREIEALRTENPRVWELLRERGCVKVDLLST